MSDLIDSQYCTSSCPSSCADAPPPPQTPIPTEEFTYTACPIDSSSGEIRLLKIHPATSPSDPISAALVTTNVKQPSHVFQVPAYGALSYYWGAPVFDTLIIVDGSKFMITASLCAALKGHRADVTGDEPELLWVDAICINQNDKDEYSGQIAVMENIYRRAVRVFVDFGGFQGRGGWEGGYELMLRVCAVREKMCERGEDFDFTDSGVCESAGLPPFGDASWDIFGLVLLSPWLKRTWVIQEVVLAREIRCRFGRFLFDWEALVGMMRFMEARERETLVERVQMEGRLSLERMVSLRSDYRVHSDGLDYMYQGGKLSPVKLLWTTRDCEVSNPRDKIVGLLGILLPTFSWWRFASDVDYTWSVETLFHAFAKFVLSRCRREDHHELLSFAGISRRRKVEPGTAEAAALELLPSWVPDWLGHESPGPAVFFMLREEPFNAAKGTATVMCAVGNFGKDTYALESFRKDNGSMSLIGNSLGSIRWTSKDEAEVELQNDLPTTPSKITTRGKELVRWKQWHNAAAKVLQEARMEGQLSRYEDVDTAFALTLLGGNDYKGANATPTSTPIESPSQTLAEVLADLSADEEGPNIQRDEPKHVAMFKAQVLGYIGLVPACTVPGDEVFLLGGAPVPFVLRRRQFRRYILGEITETEAMDNWEPLLIL
ncbi:heterokaryon incompatibility protein-domain-containing protein [Podospora aff. communis PSN243]|uniref:Heterokaryon incompatibility protein-domain-containing protein n=1 Tax=Podospora aff. communis PSN243 TaxID=3040156 RepID=A0AAV9GAW8_9PEZI|nr:heterokaryon incompatibility protein-domain-containing protein [Podospora aff. communis PSN243]